MVTGVSLLPRFATRKLKVMETDEAVEKGSVFEEIVRRFGNPDVYDPGKMNMSFNRQRLELRHR